MPIKYQLKPNENLVIITHVGAIPDDEFLSFYETFYENIIADKAFDHLVDLRQADSYERTSAALNELVGVLDGYFSKLTSRLKIAVIAPDDLSFGLAKMFSAFSSPVPIEFKVFRTPGEGLDWLDAPGDLLETP